MAVYKLLHLLHHRETDNFGMTKSNGEYGRVDRFKRQKQFFEEIKRNVPSTKSSGCVRSNGEMICYIQALGCRSSRSKDCCCFVVEIEQNNFYDLMLTVPAG